MIKKYSDQDGVELWQVYVNVRSRGSQLRAQRRVNGIKAEDEARKIELQLIRQCERELSNKEAQGQTWGHIVEAFEQHLSSDQSTGLKITTRLDYVATIRKHTQEWWYKTAASLSRADARELFQQLQAKGLSIGHQKKMKIVIQKIFVFGMEHRMIHGVRASPVEGIQFGKEEEKKPEILTLTEIKQLLSVAKSLDHTWYPVWAMALLTGCRNGELFALLWSDIDFDNKIISLTKSYNCRTRSIKSTKSGYWRTIPISSELETLLKELKLKAGSRKEVLPRLPHWEKGGQARLLRQFCQGIGIPSIKFHTLRACFATQLIRQGIPPIQIQKICGWKDLETMQRYVRLAGIEVTGVTESLKLLPETQVMAEVVNLFQPSTN
jgi:integrase